jgi:hypothetical protein
MIDSEDDVPSSKPVVVIKVSILEVRLCPVVRVSDVVEVDGELVALVSVWPFGVKLDEAERLSEVIVLFVPVAVCSLIPVYAEGGFDAVCTSDELSPMSVDPVALMASVGIGVCVG